MYCGVVVVDGVARIGGVGLSLCLGPKAVLLSGCDWPAWLHCNQGRQVLTLVVHLGAALALLAKQIALLLVVSAQKCSRVHDMLAAIMAESGLLKIVCTVVVGAAAVRMLMSILRGGRIVD